MVKKLISLSGMDGVVIAVYVTLYSRGKTTLAYGLSYALGSHGLGYRVISTDLDDRNAGRHMLTDFCQSRGPSYDRGWIHVPESADVLSMATTSMERGARPIVVMDGGRTPTPANKAKASRSADLVLMPVQDIKDVEEIGETLSDLADLREKNAVCFVVTSVEGDIPSEIQTAADHLRIPILGSVPRLSPDARNIIRNGEVPDQMSVRSSAAVEFRRAFEPIARAVAGVVGQPMREAA